MTYTIEQLKRWYTNPEVNRAINNFGTSIWAMALPELIAEVETLQRELRAQEITTINERLRTARECAEIADAYAAELTAASSMLKELGHSGTTHQAGAETAEAMARSIRAKFGVPA